MLLNKKIKSATAKSVLVIIPDELTFDLITDDLEDHLPKNTDLRYANFWHQLEDEARARHQDVVVYFPKEGESARTIRRSMTEIYLACPEACGIVVSATDLSADRDPFHTEVQIQDASSETLATSIFQLLNRPPAAT
jgi:virulence-associated protein VapD